MSCLTSIGSLLGHHRDLSNQIKTQQTHNLVWAKLDAMRKYVSLKITKFTVYMISKLKVCVAPNGTQRQKSLGPYARSINMSLSEDPTRYVCQRVSCNNYTVFLSQIFGLSLFTVSDCIMVS